MYNLRFEPPMDPPEPEVAGYCECCGNEIYVGEDYYDIEDCAICSECLVEWMDRYYKKIAEKDYKDYNEPDPDQAYNDRQAYYDRYYDEEGDA